MGKHYVPQKHLLRFESDDSPGHVWMYDKQTGKWALAHVSKVAQEADFYDEDVEKELAQEIERPGNICIAKLAGRESLNDEERGKLAFYMMTMATRGPRRRRKAEEEMPGVLENVVESTRERIEEWGRASEGNAAKAAALLVELEEVRGRFAKSPPQQIIDQIRIPFWSDRTVEGVESLAWHILPAPPSVRYVTCDTPAHYFEGLGVGRPDSEFTFPVSKSLAMIGERRCGSGNMRFEKPNAQFAKEVNRRTLSHAERFVFASKKEDWIETVALKSNPYLSQIRWC